MIIKRPNKRYGFRRREDRGGATVLCHINVRKRKNTDPCGALTRVLRTTRDPVTSRVVRVRQCARGHRFTTEEIPT